MSSRTVEDLGGDHEVLSDPVATLDAQRDGGTHQLLRVAGAIAWRQVCNRSRAAMWQC
jgi:hypothetical protein